MHAQIEQSLQDEGSPLFFLDIVAFPFATACGEKKGGFHLVLGKVECSFINVYFSRLKREYGKKVVSFSFRRIVRLLMDFVQGFLCRFIRLKPCISRRRYFCF